MGRLHKEEFGTIWLEERMRTIKKNGESELEQKLLTPASGDTDIKTDVIVLSIARLTSKNSGESF